MSEFSQLLKINMQDKGSVCERKSKLKPMDPKLVWYKITINDPCIFNVDVGDIDRYQRMESHKMANKRKKSTNAALLCDRRNRENQHYCFHITK